MLTGYRTYLSAALSLVGGILDLLGQAGILTQGVASLGVVLVLLGSVMAIHFRRKARPLQ